MNPIEAKLAEIEAKWRDGWDCYDETPALIKALRKSMEMFDDEFGGRSDMTRHKFQAELAQILTGENP